MSLAIVFCCAFVPSHLSEGSSVGANAKILTLYKLLMVEIMKI